MGVSLFLAKLLGVYLIIVFILLATRKDDMMIGIKAFIANHALLMFSGSLNLIGGLAILIAHPVWVWEWPVVITLLGLLMVIRGVLHLGYPSICADWGNALIRHKNFWSWFMIIALVIGLFLAANGFMH